MTTERNRPDANPIGLECHRCGAPFTGGRWHVFCGICIQILANEIAADQNIHKGGE